MLLRCYKHTIFAYISGKNAVTAFFLLLLQKIRVFAYISRKNAVTAFFSLLLHLLLKLPKQKEKMTIYSYFSLVTAKKYAVTAFINAVTACLLIRIVIVPMFIG